MLADVEYRFNQHDETIRRAESNARLQAALTSAKPADGTDVERPTRRLSTLIRRLAGTAVAA
jgi:hypothetical protein